MVEQTKDKLPRMASKLLKADHRFGISLKFGRVKFSLYFAAQSIPLWIMKNDMKVC